MSEIRRKLLIDSDISIPEYIQDGLIFELDGTNKLATGNYVWVDKIGGKGFTNDGGVVELSNGFTFNGTSTSILSCNTTLQMQYPTNSTIEIVMYPRMVNRWSPIFCPSDWNNNSQYTVVTYDVRTDKPYPVIGYATRLKIGSNQAYKISNNKLVTCSLFQNAPIYENKVKIITYNTLDTGAASNRSVMRVGGRIDGSNKVAFSGDIHAIRVYNRKLTEEEVLHNQSIDILKYNISI